MIYVGRSDDEKMYLRQSRGRKEKQVDIHPTIQYSNESDSGNGNPVYIREIRGRDTRPPDDH